MLDDVLDVSGPAERTGKHRGTDLLDGTVTLPLILADLGLPDLRTVTSREEAEAFCDRIAATGALEETRTRAAALVAEAKDALRGSRCPTRPIARRRRRPHRRPLRRNRRFAD